MLYSMFGAKELVYFYRSWKVKHTVCFKQGWDMSVQSPQPHKKHKQTPWYLFRAEISIPPALSLPFCFTVKGHTSPWFKMAHLSSHFGNSSVFSKNQHALPPWIILGYTDICPSLILWLSPWPWKGPCLAGYHGQRSSPPSPLTCQLTKASLLSLESWLMGLGLRFMVPIPLEKTKWMWSIWHKTRRKKLGNSHLLKHSREFNNKR